LLFHYKHLLQNQINHYFVSELHFIAPDNWIASYDFYSKTSKQFACNSILISIKRASSFRYITW